MAETTKRVETNLSVTDKQIKRLIECNPLPENEVYELCEQVITQTFLTTLYSVKTFLWTNLMCEWWERPSLFVGTFTVSFMTWLSCLIWGESFPIQTICLWGTTSIAATTQSRRSHSWWLWKLGTQIDSPSWEATMSRDRSHKCKCAVYVYRLYIGTGSTMSVCGSMAMQTCGRSSRNCLITCHCQRVSKVRFSVCMGGCRRASTPLTILDNWTAFRKCRTRDPSVTCCGATQTIGKGGAFRPGVPGTVSALTSAINSSIQITWRLWLALTSS